MKRNLAIFGISLGVLIIVGGLYYVLIVQGGTLAVSLPKPFKFNTQDIVVVQTQEDSGAVLGETDPYENPLRDIYVNPFAK